MEIIYSISIFLLLIALSISVYRLLKGPYAVDRIICLDFLALVIAGLLAIHSIRSNLILFLDIVLVLSVISFISTVVLAQLIEKQKGLRND